MTNTLGVAEAKAKLSEILERVRERGDRYIIERRGRAIAAVVPLEDLPLSERIAADDWVASLLNAGPDGERLADILDEIVKERAGRGTRSVSLEGQ